MRFRPSTGLLVGGGEGLGEWGVGGKRRGPRSIVNLFIGVLPHSQGLGALVLSLPDPPPPAPWEQAPLLYFPDRQLRTEAGSVWVWTH